MSLQSQRNSFIKTSNYGKTKLASGYMSAVAPVVYKYETIHTDAS